MQKLSAFRRKPDLDGAGEPITLGLPSLHSVSSHPLQPQVRVEFPISGSKGGILTGAFW